MKMTAFYKFFPIKLKDLKPFQKTLKKEGEGKVRGLLLLAAEGINGTLCGPEPLLENYKQLLNSLFQNQDFLFKDSFSNKWGFRRLSVKLKKEIIRMDRLSPAIPNSYRHLNPEDWEKQLQNKPQVLDVRNTYEVELGKFKNAKHLNIQSFKEFPSKLKQTKGLNKQATTLIYCTGGIRCEKAIKVMEEEGFKKVYQLKGGILNYLKNHSHSQFEKECFVFDHRVALDQNLKPSPQYKLCPHCGQPGKESVACAHCGQQTLVCHLCLNKAPEFKTCSKNCSYHLKSGHEFKKFHHFNKHTLIERS